jgi:histidinol-phosphate aminotransferase
LLKLGIIVRDMNSYGLPDWIRVSIGTAEQNARFLAELQRQPNLAIHSRQPASV